MRISDWSSDVCSSDLNLIDNAIGFSPPGGTVRVVVRAARRGAILSILDQGPGVAPENFERIFEKGYSSRPRNDGGPEAAAPENFGMGLWIVRRNEESTGGSLRSENPPSHGPAANQKRDG